MLQIAIALLGRPKALIMDGAFDGLDLTNRELVCKLLKTATLEWGSAVLVVVSSISEALHKLSAACLNGNSDGWTLL
jgi:ABC-type multidrug transport system ATPase subunit